MLWCAPLRAADWGGVLALTSDYVFRGVSRTDRGAAAQGGLHLRSPERWFASVWASSLGGAPELLGDVELNLHAGRGFDLADDWALSAAWARYLYPDSGSGRYDWDELSASLVHADRLVLTASLSPNAPQQYAGQFERRRASALEASWRQPLAGPWSLVAGAGRFAASGPSAETYRAWNVGLAAQLGALEVGLARFDVDAAGRRRFGTAAADGRWVLSLAWRYAAH